MAHPFSQLAIVTGAVVCLGCNQTPTAPETGGPTSNAPAPAPAPALYASPPIRGLVRETNGGPIAGVTVGLRTTVGTYVRGPKVVSDAAGVFFVPSSTDLCPRAGAVVLETLHRDFWFPEAGFRCTSDSNPQEVSVEVKGQRYVTAASGAPVVITVSNDDLNWLTDENGYSCGPCRIVGLKLPAQSPVDVVVEWSGPNPIHIWVEGDLYAGDLVRLREIIPLPGDTAVKINVLPEWRDVYQLMLKVGLPYGGRFPAGSPPVSVRIEVR